MRLLIDIGGTYVRLAVQDENKISHFAKYRAASFPALEDAIAQYCKDKSLPEKGALRIATAGYEDDGIWKFVNRNPWHINPADIKARGWTIECILNDFEAGTWALTDLADSDFEIIKPATGASQNLALVGPGTGMGLGYLIQNQRQKMVLKTHGGNMPAAALTAEQRDIVKIFEKSPYARGVPVYENFVSGPGLYHLYYCACVMADTSPLTLDTAGLLDHKDDPQVLQAFRLFHEFFGIFSANAVITGHAYGGLYITGGVMEHLIENALWDFSRFEDFFVRDYADSVRRDLALTPIYRLKLDNPAMQGLMAVPLDG